MPVAKMIGGPMDGQLLAVAPDTQQIHVLLDGPHRIIMGATNGSKSAPRTARTNRAIYQVRDVLATELEFTFVREIPAGEPLEGGTDPVADPEVALRMVAAAQRTCLHLDRTIETLMEAYNMIGLPLGLVYLRAVIGALLAVHFSKIVDQVGATEAVGWLDDVCQDVTQSLHNRARDHHRKDLAVTLTCQRPVSP